MQQRRRSKRSLGVWLCLHGYMQCASIHRCADSSFDSLLTTCAATHPAPALPRTQEKMRANEAQVAELTRRLNEVELDRSRLASRARLLEQVWPPGVCTRACGPCSAHGPCLLSPCCQVTALNPPWPGHTSCLAPAPASCCSQPCCCCCCCCRILRLLHPSAAGCWCRL